MAKKYTLKHLNKTGSSNFDETRFSINYRQQLNPSQYEAVSATDGSYLVIAGAGTGKTRTLVFRVARLIEMGVDPNSILLMTFTRKAAKEMMSRAASLLDSRCSRISGGTFHSYANLILRKYASVVGFNSGFTILDQGDSEDVINLIRVQVNDEKDKKRFPKKNTIFKILSLSINTNRPVKEILEEEFPHFYTYLDKILEIQKLYKAYKFRNNSMDYDDLLLYLKDFLLDFGPGAKSLLSSIKYIMIDEYQDTNYLQSEIVKGFAQINPNVMVVGDDSQSIYSFRGANFKNIMNFPSLFPNTKIIKLEENYRSTQEILNFTNHIIDLAVEKYPKELFTRNPSGELPAIVSAANENMQSRFIVDRILELSEEGVPLEDISVLFRSSYSSFNLEIELNKANIPFIKFGGMKFIETAHVKDILAFIRISANPKDMVSWYRILLLHEGIGPKKAQQIMEIISNTDLDFSKNNLPALPNAFQSKLGSLFGLVKNISNTTQSPTDKAEIVLDYYNPIFKSKYDDFNKRKKDLDILLNITQNYNSVDSLLADMALDPPRDSVVDLDATDAEDEYLTLSTIHSAKGLEWHSVFIIHAADGFFPSSQSIESLDALEEERRLMYVASTRAKQNLHICYPMQIFDRYNGVTFSKPSRFISDISEELADEWLLEEEF